MSRPSRRDRRGKLRSGFSYGCLLSPLQEHPGGAFDGRTIGGASITRTSNVVPFVCPVKLDTVSLSSHILPVLLVAVILGILFGSASPQTAFCEGATLTFSPPQWEFGTIPAGSRAFLTLLVTNSSGGDVTVSILPTCDCLSTGPSRRTIAPGSTAEFRFSILAEDDESGEVRESYLVQTDLEGMDHFYFMVHGTVKAKQ